MTDPKTLSEKEAVMRERVAFAKGMRENRCDPQVCACPACATAIHEATRRYPLPRIRRPRVVADNREGHRREFRVFEGQMQTRSIRQPYWSCVENGHTNADGTGLAIDAVRVKLWADLLASPLEEVEAE
jgi:hypothetical protein